MSSARVLTERLRALAEPVVVSQGCELVAIELLGGGGRRTVRVSIDRPGGATVGDCTSVSRRLSPTLDAEDPIHGAYDLEVSTPGIERPLQREEDFVRFAGCEVRLKPWGVDARRKVRGRLLGVDGGVVRVDVAGDVREYPLDDIERANLVLTLEQFARLGQGLHPLSDGESP